MSEVYTYSIVDDFPNHKVALDALHDTIEASEDITTALVCLDTAGDACNIVFSAALASGEKTALDALVAAHDGMLIVFNPKIASKILDGTAAIVSADWEVVGGVAVNAQFYVPDLTKAVSIVQFNCKADGAGAKLRLVEVDDDDVRVVMSPEFDIPDTDDAWHSGKVTTNQVPRAGNKTYQLEAKLGAATSASVRFASAVLLEMVIE